MEAIVASTGSAGMIGVLRWGTLVALLVLRRFRHLLVFIGSFLAVLLVVRQATVDRPRPFGVELRGSWAGWAMPSRPVAILTATLVGILYTLVPVGRWRQLGKWVATGLVAAFALARIHLGVDAPSDAIVGAVIGVAVSVAAYRLFVPNEIFPVTYKRGRSAHLDVSGRRGEAIRQALADQLGLTALEVEPFGCPARPGRPRCGSRSRTRPATPDMSSASCTPRATCGPTAPTSSAGRCCTGGWRTRSRSTPSSGWSSRRTTLWR
jgi:membrane-associated phospholipid phosphatase